MKNLLCVLFAATLAGCAPTMVVDKKAANYQGTVSSVAIAVRAEDWSKTRGSGTYQGSARAAIDRAQSALHSGLAKRLPEFLTGAGLPASVVSNPYSPPAAMARGNSTHLLILRLVAGSAECQFASCQATISVDLQLLDARNGALAWSGGIKVPEPTARNPIDAATIDKFGTEVLTALRAHGLVLKNAK